MEGRGQRRQADGRGRWRGGRALTCCWTCASGLAYQCDATAVPYALCMFAKATRMGEGCANRGASYDVAFAGFRGVALLLRTGRWSGARGPGDALGGWHSLLERGQVANPLTQLDLCSRRGKRREWEC
eukprot:scaffold205610_cov39-Tisochrysis_lutea.AAC.3